MRQPSSNVKRLLDVASERAFKIWRLSGWLLAITFLVCIALVVGLILALIRWWAEPVVTVGGIVFVVVVAAVIFTVPTLIMRAVGYRKTLGQMGIGLGMGTLGWIAARAQLHLFDRWYRRLGSIDRLTGSGRRQRLRRS
jgi:hypothetical protein